MHLVIDSVFSIWLGDAPRKPPPLDEAQAAVHLLGGRPPPAADLEDLEAHRRRNLFHPLDDVPRDAPPLVVRVDNQASHLGTVGAEGMRVLLQGARTHDPPAGLGHQEHPGTLLGGLDTLGDALLYLGEGVGRKAVLAQVLGVLGADGADDNFVIWHCG